MRISAKTIHQEGERLSPHSKFYIWQDWLFEPGLYRGKPTKSYKPVTDVARIEKAFERVNTKIIPTVVSVCPSLYKPNNKTFENDRYTMMDFRKD